MSILQQQADEFMRGYFVCALWSSTDDKDHPLDELFEVDDIDKESARAAREECTDFMIANEADLLAYAEQIKVDPGQGSAWDYAGHDFWLTRNGHGAGFWDRGLGALGDRLADAARIYKDKDLYLGDDGKLYFE